MGFAEAQAAIDGHDVDGLTRVLDAEPGLVHATGGANANLLLGMAVATGSRPATTLLLQRGADPAGANVHGWTALHQAGYGNHAGLAELLLAAGASPAAEARGAGGTPLVVALFWGNRRVTEVLVRAGAYPANLRVAAGTGTGDLATAPADPRGFHRPHSGFPAWTPGDSREEAIDEALSWAARNDRAASLAPLVDLGARVDADVYRGTALGWAAWTGALDAITELLRLGAAVDGRTSFGGPDHGEGATPLMLAAQAGRRRVVDVLLAAGADRGARDALHEGTAADWAGVGGHAPLAKHLRG